MQVDISLMGYEQFIKFIFDHPVTEEEDRDSRWSANISCEVSVPAALIGHVARMCRELLVLGERFSPEQIDQGLWFLVSYPGEFPQYLLDVTVPFDQRIACVCAMYHMYADYVPTIKTVVPNGFDMWWDILCTGFWSAVERRLYPVNLDNLDISDLLEKTQALLERSKKVTTGEIVNSEETRQASMAQTVAKHAAMIDQLTQDERVLFDSLFETLQRILALSNDICQYCALHGLGHLHHPGVKALVHAYLLGPGAMLPETTKAWVVQCAEGKIM